MPEVLIAAGAVQLPGELRIPFQPKGLVVFAHGSGSSRFSRRNRYVARVLNEAGLATLLFDLLTPDEAESRSNVFDIELLASRLISAVEFAKSQPKVELLPVALFGASTGAAAALVAATLLREVPYAVVSRGGRPDLAEEYLGRVRSPTLLIVGGHDYEVLALNRYASAQLHCDFTIEVMPKASHLFEEPGTLESAAELARDWLVARLPQPARQS